MPLAGAAADLHQHHTQLLITASQHKQHPNPAIPRWWWRRLQQQEMGVTGPTAVAAAVAVAATGASALLWRRVQHYKLTMAQATEVLHRLQAVVSTQNEASAQLTAELATLVQRMQVKQLAASSWLLPCMCAACSFKDHWCNAC
jgi:hypothetical protein